MIRTLLLVGLGGFFGSVVRYGVKLLTDRFLPGHFPYATFLVNVIGCFIIGLLFGFVQRNQLDNNTWLILGAGFCGAFTTFSTFVLENNALMTDKQSNTALIYTLLSLVIGLLLCRLGIAMAR